MTGRIAGKPHETGSRDGEGHDSLLAMPTDMAVSADHVYVVDSGNLIRKIDVATMSVVTLYSGRGAIEAISCDDHGVVYFTEVGHGS